LNFDLYLRKYYCMRITLVTIICLFFLIGCSTNNGVDIPTNQLLDKYYLDQLITNGVTQNLSSCRKQSFIIFNANGTFSRRDWFDFSPSNCVLDGIDDGQFVYNPQDSTLNLIFTDTEIWHNVQIIGNRIKFTWDENLDGVDEHYVEFLKR